MTRFRVKDFNFGGTMRRAEWVAEDNCAGRPRRRQSRTSPADIPTITSMLSQCSNDTFPTTMHTAGAEELVGIQRQQGAEYRPPSDRAHVR